MEKIVEIKSEANNLVFPVYIFSPDNCDTKEADVCVVLHGRQSKEDFTKETLKKLYPWTNPINTLSNFYKTLFVIPLLGNKAHIDSPVDPSVRRFTFLTEELPKYLCQEEGVSINREKWMFIGFSMGGTAATNICSLRPDIFSVSVNFGGNCDPAFYAKTMGNPPPSEDVLGEYPNDNYEKWTSVYLLNKLERKDVAFAFGCGIQDPRIDNIREAHKKALSLNLPSVYMEYPGAHVYDDKHIVLQLACAYEAKRHLKQ